MPREKESYRDNLELIMERYPGKMMLTVKEISALWGKDQRTVKKAVEKYIVPHNGVSIAVLARMMS